MRKFLFLSLLISVSNTLWATYWGRADRWFIATLLPILPVVLYVVFVAPRADSMALAVQALSHWKRNLAIQLGEMAFFLIGIWGHISFLDCLKAVGFTALFVIPLNVWATKKQMVVGFVSGAKGGGL